MLCSNRSSLPGSPSTCLLDTVLVPLPSFLFILALPIALSYQRGRTLPRTGSRSCSEVACLWVMTILELLGLTLENLGVGLLPITTIGLMFAFFVLLRERKGPTRVVSAVLASYWFLLAVMFIIKSTRLHLLVKMNPTTIKNSKMPSLDWFVYNVVMTICIITFFIEECLELILSYRQAGNAKAEAAFW